MIGQFFRVLLLVLLVFGVWLGITATTHANPFVDGRPAVVTDPGPTESSSLSPVGQWVAAIAQAQRQLHQSLTTALTALQQGGSSAALWWLVAFGFLYGVLHVLGPGHGKLIVSSYFLGHAARWSDGVWAGLVLAVGHTMSAVLIVLVLAVFMAQGQLSVVSQSRYVELAAYALMLGIGLWLLVRTLTQRADAAALGCVECLVPTPKMSAATPTTATAATDTPLAKRFVADRPPPLLQQPTAMGLLGAAGIVPCTGTIIILLFTLSHGLLWAGLLAIIALALGMWLTITLIGTASIALRRRLQHSDAQSAGWQQAVLRLLRAGAALVVCLVAGSLLVGTLANLGYISLT